MRIWTIQSPLVWELLSEHKVLHVRPDLCEECGHFPDSFSWMCEQMAKRLPDYQGHLPWWGWHHPKPDLRFYSRKGINGTQRVMIELEIAEPRVLLSNESAWIGVLNDFFIPYSDAEGEVWDETLQANGIDDQQRPLPEPWQSRLIASWERIFDLPEIRTGDSWSDFVQATFEELRLADVVQVKPYAIRSSVPAQQK